MAKSSKSRKRSVGPFSKDRTLTDVDKRTREGRIYRTIFADLVDHVGGHPSAAELLLIQSATLKALRLSLLSESIISNEQLPAGENEKSLAWANSMRLDLQALGLARRVKDITPSLSDIIAASAKEAAE